MDSGTYIKKRVEALRDHSQELYRVSENVSNDFNSWSALKLILHSAAVNMYTTVHANQGTGDTFYIDALAGSGISTYNSDRCFVGSPLVACRAAQEPFTKMYFVDSNKDHCEALRRRLEYAFDLPDYTEPDAWEVITGDSNKEIAGIIQEIQEIGDYDRYFNYYCFVDNQGLDVNWSFIEELTPTPYGDLLINLPITHAIGRNVNQETTDALNKFYGIDTKEINTNYNSRKRMRQVYQERLAERNREVQESTQVRANIGSFYYDLLYATRKIDEGNGYMNVIRYVKRFVESVHAGDVDRMLDILDGNQDVIGSFLPNESIDDELPEDDDQSGLDDFF